MPRPADTARRIQKHIANLNHPDKSVADRAEYYLMRYYGARALEPLIAACSHPNPQVRYRAGWALGHTRDPRAFDTLLRLTQDPDGAVRYDCAIALGILGDSRSIAPLIDLMTTPDEEHAVDSAAATGLVRLGDPAIPALLEVLERGSSQARMLAAWALGRAEDESNIEPLSRLLGDADERIRIAGIEALADLGGTQALTAIENCLNDPVPAVRENAAYWIKDLREQQGMRQR